MPWNWQQTAWPQFTFDSNQLQPLEDRFLLGAGHLFGAFAHLNADETNQLTVELISSEALKTSEIEGEYLNRESLQSSIRHQLGLDPNAPFIPTAERGIAEMMIDLYRSFQEPLTHDTLFRWHKVLLQGRGSLREVGRYRTGAETMQIVSASRDGISVHFEAPPSPQIPTEMEEFIQWFNASGQEGPNRLSALCRAGIAHLWFIAVHPFEDGNGRIGRALAEKALAQAVHQPTLIALSQRIERERKAYYSALAQTNRTLEITDWLLYFARTILDAQDDTRRRIDFLVEKALLFDRLRGQINPRQEKALLRMFREGPEGFRGGLSASNYISITKTSQATATRDLNDLVDKGALTKTGERRGTRYFLAIGSIENSSQRKAIA